MLAVVSSGSPGARSLPPTKTLVCNRSAPMHRWRARVEDPWTDKYQLKLQELKNGNLVHKRSFRVQFTILIVNLGNRAVFKHDIFSATD